jgi:hypothetical protein
MSVNQIDVQITTLTKEEINQALLQLCQGIFDAASLQSSGGGTVPSGTGWRHVTGGAEDAAASTPNAAQVGAEPSGTVAIHAALATGVHGAGASTLATVANISTHAGLTSGVHGLASMSQVADAPSDGNPYVRKNAAWAVSTAGGIAKESHIPLVVLSQEVTF